MARLARREILYSYAEDVDRRYIHLLDGGLSDNLGLRNAVAALPAAGEPWRAMREIGHGDVRRILVIVVNAEPAPKRKWGFNNRGASTLQVARGRGWRVAGPLSPPHRSSCKRICPMFSPPWLATCACT